MEPKRRRLDEIIQKCRTAHQFIPDEALSQEELNEILETSLQAPNHKFTFPWKYYLIGPKTRESLWQLQCEMKGIKIGDESYQKNKQKFFAPPHLLVACWKKEEDSQLNWENSATLSCSIQLIALKLAAIGYAYKWSSGKVTRCEQTYDVLHIDPLAYTIAGFIWMGKAAKPAPPKKRPSLGEVLQCLE